MRGADVILNALKMEGVKFIAGFPGGGLNDIIDGMLDTPEIMPILTRHERVAVDIADGYARASGNPGVAMVCQGAGAAHAFAGLAQAFSNSSPVLCLTGSPPRASLQNQEVQEINVIEVFRSVTKWQATINMPERIPEMVRRAFTNLRSGRPNPVSLKIPTDIGAAELTDEQAVYKPMQRGWATGANLKDVDDALQVLLKAKNPVIYAGAGVLWAKGADALLKFADMAQVPVVTTLNAKSVFPENHPLSLGMGGVPRSLFGVKPAHDFVAKADVIFAIGNCFKSTATMRQPVPEGVTLIHSNIDEREINKNNRADMVILGDSRFVLERRLIEDVEDLVGPQGHPANAELHAEIKKAHEEFIAAWSDSLESTDKPMSPFRVVWDLQKAVSPDDTVLTHNSGFSRLQTCMHYRPTFPRGYLGMGGESAMGWSIGAAMGAKLAFPDKFVCAMIGDGAFGMTGFDLETSVRHEIPVTILLINNYELGITAFFQGRESMVKLSGDYTTIAKGLGAYSERIEDHREVVDAIRRAKQNEEGQSALIEIIVRREGNRQLG